MTSGTGALVGRESDLATLDASLDPEQLPATVVVEGEAGVGKTSLCAAAVEAARGRGVTTLAAHPLAAEQELALTGLGDLLEPVLEHVLDTLPAPQARALRVALLLEQSAEAADPRTLGVAFLSALRRLAEDGPLLVFVDDVQWLDPSSSTVLAYAARRVGAARVALLLARRAGHPDAVTGGLDDVRLLALGGLSLGALHRVLRERLGVVLSRPVLRRVYDASAGNPFYALEIVRALAAGDPASAARVRLPIPEKLEELPRNRIAELPALTRRALILSACLVDARIPTLSSALDADADAALQPAVAAEVVVVEDERVRFAHPLLAEAVYSSPSATERRHAHAELAEVVDDPEERARHLALAADGPSEDVANLLEASARLARARGAPTAAAELAERAVELTPDDRMANRFRRSLAAGGYSFEAGDSDRAARLFGAAVEASAPGPERAEALWRLARTHALAADHPAAVTLYREALVHAGEDVGARIEAEAGLGVAMMRMLEDLPTAARHARAAVDLAEAHGLRGALPELMARRALIDGLRGDPGALELARRAAELEQAARASGESEDASFARTLGGAGFMQGVLLLWADRIEESRASFESARAHVLEIGDESSLPLLGRYLATASWLAGDWSSALLEGDEAYEIASQTGQISQQGVLGAVRSLVLAHLGRVDEARATAEEAAKVSAETGAMFGSVLAASALGFLELSLGRPAETDRHLAPLLERLQAAGVREPGAMRFVADEIEALILLDRLAVADTHAAELERRALELDRPSALAAVMRCRGLLEAARGDSESAVASLAAALSQHDRVAQPFERARTLLALGSVERRARRKRAARDALQQALAIFESLGASLWADRARAELARVGGRAPAGDELTPTERRVAALVAEGLATKEVASLLFVSPKTVEGHLSHIYAKLGVRSRTELASRLAARQRPTPRA